MVERTPLYTINNFLKFERKIYQVLGRRIGKPIRLKSVLFYICFLVLEVVLYFTPVIGAVIRMIPPGLLLLIPGVIAYLLSDIGTENRTPLAYFRSFLQYHWRRMRRVTYFQGRELPKPDSHQIRGYLVYRESK